jgi:hypothetical protein
MALDKSSIVTRTSAVELSSCSQTEYLNKCKELSAKKIPSGGEVDVRFEMWDVGCLEVLAVGREVLNVLSTRCRKLEGFTKIDSLLLFR